MREQLTDMLSKLTLRYFVLHKETQTVETDIATVRAALGALDGLEEERNRIESRTGYENMLKREAEEKEIQERANYDAR